ncbi:MAG: hypothetical protein AB7T74_01300 [Clostridia bacterium]|jgi:hypothetical protein
MNYLLVLIAIQILVSILLIVWVRLKVMRSLDDGDSISRVRREIGALIVELDGSADRNITLIEDRLRELKECIAEADKRIVMLSNDSVSVNKTVGKSFPPTYQSIVRAPQPLSEPVSSSTGRSSFPDQLLSSPEVASLEGLPAPLELEQSARPLVQPLSSEVPEQSSSVPFIRFSEKPLVFDDSFSERVARLHKRGFSSDIIAAKLKATIAEVDLAIAAGGNPAEGRGEV